jgi:hypothetical protein
MLRGLGPSLAGGNPPVSNALPDPLMHVHDNHGGFLAGTNNWRRENNAGSEIEVSGIAPTNDLESAAILTLAPGAYTAVVEGANKTSGIGLVEIYNLN